MVSLIGKIIIIKVTSRTECNTSQFSGKNVHQNQRKQSE